MCAPCTTNDQVKAPEEAEVYVMPLHGRKVFQGSSVKLDVTVGTVSGKVRDEKDEGLFTKG